MTEWKDISLNTLSSIITEIKPALFNILGAILVIIVGWLVSRIIRFILKKLLRLAKVNSLSDRINEANLFGSLQAKINLEKIILGFVKWVLILIIVIVAADITELTVISTEIANLLRYLPILFSAVVIFMIGLYASNLIRSMLKNVLETMRLGASKIISSVVFYVLIIFVTITALNHAGIDTQIITNNFTLVLGAFLLAFALAFGLGSREVVGDLLRTFYARKNYSVGDKIKFNEIQGTIVAIDSIFLTLETDNKKQLVIPVREIVNSRIELLQ